MPVVSVTGDQTIDAAGQAHDEVVTTFTVTRPDGTTAGPFTATVPDNANAVAATEAFIQAKIDLVNSLYGLNP